MRLSSVIAGENGGKPGTTQSLTEEDGMKAQMQVIRDEKMRVITVMATDDDVELTKDDARAMAEQYLKDEGTALAWDFDCAVIVNYNKIEVYFIGM